MDLARKDQLDNLFNITSPNKNVAPPPLKRMSTNLTNSESQDESKSNTADESDSDLALEIDESMDTSANESSPVPVINNKPANHLDSLLDKLALKKVSAFEQEIADSTASSDTSMTSPPPLRKCVPSPEPNKSRRKQALPRNTAAVNALQEDACPTFASISANIHIKKEAGDTVTLPGMCVIFIYMYVVTTGNKPT